MRFDIVDWAVGKADPLASEMDLLSLASLGQCVAHIWQAPLSLVVPRSYQRFAALERARAEFEQRGFGAFVRRWETFHAYAGQAVKIVDNGRLLHEGRAVGVDMMGRFLLETEAGQVAVMVGDLSLRLQDG